MHTSSRNFSRGFTLLEILVSLSIFALVAGLMATLFLSSYRSQRHSYAFLNAHNNVRFTLESMSREMRTGTNFVEIVSNSELEFKNQTGQTVRYRLRNGRIERSEGAGYAPLTAPEVTVEAFKFWIDGQGVGDDEQPRVTISLKISAQLGNQRASTVLQTTVTARELDS